MSVLMILLTVLKWIGIILLIILAVILGLVLLVLIVPINYRADVVYGGGKDVNANVKVSYFWPIIRFRLDYTVDDGLIYWLKVLFFSVMDSRKPGDDVVANDAIGDDVIADDAVGDDVVANDAIGDDVIADDAFDDSELLEDEDYNSEIRDEYEEELESEYGEEETDESLNKDNSETYTGSDEAMADDDSTDSEDSYDSEDEYSDDKISIFDRIGALFNGIGLFFKGIRRGIIKVKNAIDSGATVVHNIVDGLKDAFAKVKELKSKMDSATDKGKRLKRLYDAELTKKTIELVKKQLFKIVKHILPNKVKGYVHYGFSDPATTGEVLALISAFYPVIDRTFTVVPDFEESVIEADVHIKGRIHLIVIVGAALRVLISPYAIKTYKRAKRIIKH